MAIRKAGDAYSGLENPGASDSVEQQAFAAWEEIDAGRFMPRRVRGSCQGRALG